MNNFNILIVDTISGLPFSLYLTLTLQTSQRWKNQDLLHFPRSAYELPHIQGLRNCTDSRFPGIYQVFIMTTTVMLVPIVPGYVVCFRTQEWGKEIVIQMWGSVWALKTYIKIDMIDFAYNPSAVMGRWEAVAKEFPEVLRLSTHKYTEEINKETLPQTKWKNKIDSSLSSELYTGTPVYTNLCKTHSLIFSISL